MRLLKIYLKITYVIVLAIIVCVYQLTAKTYDASSAVQIDSLCKIVAAGDTITMVNGTWVNQKIVFKATGTLQHPIVLRSASNQSVILTGISTLRIAGNYLVVDGLKFENGYSSSGAVIEFRGLDGTVSNYCRLTRTSIKSYNPSNDSIDYKWISLYGQYNRVDHCTIEGKTHSGTTLVVWLSGEPNYHRIDHNYFGPRPLLVDKNGVSINGGETIRVGTSDWSMYNSFTTVEYNYFEQCNGEIEVISNKSCENTYRYNVFASCQGMLTLRHGNRCTVYDNYFFCNNTVNSGGIRIIGEDHKVYNNYIENSEGTSMKTGITMVNGVPNSPLNRYFQVKRAQVVFNTLIGNRYSMNIGAGKDSELSLPPLDCTIANNLVWSTRDQLITYTDIPINMKYEGNIFYGSTLGITKPAGIKLVDPKMVYTTDSVWKQTAASPGIDSAVGTYSFVATDLDGQQRVAPFDIGADEFSNTAVTQRPIKKTEVGVSALITTVEKSNSRTVPNQFAVIRNYPNPFNPATVIEFSVPYSGDIVLKIYNGIGEEIETSVNSRAEGNRTYHYTFNASHLATGLYYAELRYGNRVAVHKMLLLK